VPLDHHEVHNAVTGARSRRVLRPAARRFLSRPRVNRVVTRPLRIFARLLPHAVTDRLPVRGPFTVRTPAGTRFRFVGLQGDAIAHAVYWRGIAGWEPETVRVLEELTPRAACFLDVGANDGLLTVIAARSNPNLLIHAFEPAPAAYEALKTNLAANGLSRVSAHRVALADRSGTAVLHVPRGDMTTEASMVAGLRADTVPLTVSTTTIDDIRAEYSIHCVDLMKIDTEATEHLVLAGAASVLTRDRPTIICEVLHGQEAEVHLRTIVERAGYDQYHITGKGIERREVLSGDPDYRNLTYLLLHPSRRSCVPASLRG
jgi:FkbM family methyltransferase